jgi:hypothetical protein
VSAIPEPWFDLRRRLKDVEEQLRKLRNTSPFAGTGMSVTADGVTQVDGNLNVTGTENVSGSLDVGGTLNVTGNTIIGGTLSLPAGIINNDALSNPVVPDGKYASTSGFGITFAGSFVASLTQTIPSGCTGCIVTATGSVLGQNSTASSDQLYTSIGINGGFPAQFPTGVGAGTGNTSTRGRTSYLTGLTPGGTLTVAVYASTGVASWAASPNNAAEISATFLFLR